MAEGERRASHQRPQRDAAGCGAGRRQPGGAVGRRRSRRAARARNALPLLLHAAAHPPASSRRPGPRLSLAAAWLPVPAAVPPQQPAASARSPRAARRRNPAAAAPPLADAPPAKRLKTLGAPLAPGIIRPSLLAPESSAALRAAHDGSGPYTHVVLRDLAEQPLLRAVREEVINNVQATYKETDLFKVFQTGEWPTVLLAVWSSGRQLEKRVACPVRVRQIRPGGTVEYCSLTASCFQLQPPAGKPSGDLANLDELDPESAAKPQPQFKSLSSNKEHTNTHSNHNRQVIWPTWTSLTPSPPRSCRASWRCAMHSTARSSGRE